MKTIDLSKLIDPERQSAGYGVLCEFWQGEHSVTKLGILSEIKKTHGAVFSTGYYAHKTGYFNYCRPAFNIWQAHAGGECPLPIGFTGELMLSNRLTRPFVVAGGFLNWEDRNSLYRVEENIITYRVTGVADGYRLPWE